MRSIMNTRSKHHLFQTSVVKEQHLEVPRNLLDVTDFYLSQYDIRRFVVTDIETALRTGS